MAYEVLKDKIKDQPISTIISHYIPLNKKGSALTALCPFHADTKPSMNVSDSKGMYKCFACGAGGDAITFGGGNDTPGGIVKTIGRKPVTMTFEIRQMTQDVISALKSLSCENVGVYLFNGDGQIMALKDESVATTFYPIPIKNLFVSDLKLNGLDTPDSNTLSFSFEPNWSDNAAIVTPTDFNPLTDIANS